jgi:hypothetical protein
VAQVKGQEGLLFLKKKKQKNFIHWIASALPRTPMDESFLLLFFKKEALALLP